MSLRKLFFKRKKIDWLQSYSPYEQPFAAASGKLSKTQAQANLEYLLSCKAERVQIFAELLKKFEVDVIAGLAAPSPDPLIKELHEWSGDHWQQYFEKTKHSDNHWISSNRSGENLIYSVIMDTTLVLSELIMRHRPSYRWGVDDDPENKPMRSYNRCVLLSTYMQEPFHRIEIDIEQSVVSRFLHADYVSQRLDNTWQRLVDTCISGKYEGENRETHQE